MTERSESPAPLAAALGAALLAGVLVAWTDRYWRLSVAIVALSLVATIWAFTARRLKLPPQTILVVAISIWGPLQLALHITRVPWPTTLRSIDWAMAAVSFVLGSQILRGRRARNTFLDLMLWAMTALAVAAMLQMYITPGRVFGIIPAADSVVGTLYYKNQFAAMIELAAPIALWKVYNGEIVSGGLCYAAMFAATLSSASRMGVILVLAEFLVFLILMVARRRMPLKNAVSVVAVLTLLVGAASAVAGIDNIWNRLHEPNAYWLRGTLLDSTLKMIPGHPWFGSGLGTWPEEYPRFATFDSNLYVNEAHNDWAQWASEGGLPFSLLLAALVIWLAKPSLKSVWGLGVLSVMVHSYMDYPLRDPALGFLWFTLAGGLTQTGTQPESRHSEAEGGLAAASRPESSSKQKSGREPRFSGAA
jgi:O-antigen ligase